MVDLKQIADSYNLTEEKIKPMYENALKITKEIWGEENAEGKALRKLVAKLQKKKLSGSKLMKAYILAVTEAKDFTQLILMSLQKRVAIMGDEKAVEQGLMDKQGNYIYQAGFQKGKIINPKSESYSQDFLAIDIDTKQVVQLTSRNKAITLLNNGVYELEARKNPKAENKYTITSINKEITENKPSYEQIHSALEKMPYLKDTELEAFLKANEFREVIVESYVIDINIGQKCCVTMQIPGKEEVLTVWIDDASIAENLAIAEPARVFISKANFNSERNAYVTNSMYAFANPKILPKKQDSDEEVEEEGW